jgi:LCP family protein required for cell wall assembly
LFFKPQRKHIVDSNGNLVRKPEFTFNNRNNNKPRKIWFIIIGVIIVGAIASIALVGTSALSAVGKIITKNQGQSSPFLSFLGNVQPDQLKGEGDGRINILLIGIGGISHPGGLLADTIMVASIDPKAKSIALLSIPRDLYVPIPGYSSGKINSTHSIGEQNKAKTGGGPELLKKTVSGVLDLPIHYYIRVDFNGFTKFIDALGGVTVNVDKAISDPFYPAEDMQGYKPFYIKSGSQKLDGATALKYARSRETTSDFDRARRQQQLLIAVKEKVVSLGILANPKKMSDMINILGEHLRTDMQIKEIEKIMAIAKDVNFDNVVNKVLDNSASGPLTSDVQMGGYYLVPKAGVKNFSQIQEIAHEIFSDPYLTEESAKIEVLNASNKNGVATDVSKLLKSYNYNIVKLADNNEKLTKTVIYDYTNGKKPFTIQFLKNRLKANVVIQPKKDNSTVDISVVIGDDYSN